MSNSETIQQMYAAFGRGDVATILELVAEDVEWDYGVVSTKVPWLQARHGRDSIAGFFEVLATELEFHQFEPKAILESDRLVVAVLDIQMTVKATGRRVVEEDLVHVWHFDNDGKVARYRHRVDTHQHLVAWDPTADPTARA